jgi:uncharacterized integral membrane protein
MWMVKGIFYLLVLIIMAIFFAQNSGKSVDLRFFNREYLDIPLYYIMIGSFLLGLVFSLLLAMLRELKLHSKLRSMQRDLGERDREISELRSLPLQDMDDGQEG